MSCAADSSTSYRWGRGARTSATLARARAGGSGRQEGKLITDHAGRWVENGHVLEDSRTVVRDDDLALGRLDLETSQDRHEETVKLGQQG
jgi:hypothetical protein